MNPTTENSKAALVIEDDPTAAAEIQAQLSDLGIGATLVGDGAEGLTLALSAAWSLVVVDLHLPNLGGLEICRQLRTAKPSQPILVLTANPEQMVSVLALELGADEFIRKPFHGLELRARIRALLRRSEIASTTASNIEAGKIGETSETSSTVNTTCLVFDDLVIDESIYRLSYRDVQIPLTPTEFELLLLLARHNDRIFSRDEIVSTLWEASPEVYNLNIRFHINNLRAKCKEAGITEPVITTKRGFGYRFVYRVS